MRQITVIDPLHSKESNVLPNYLMKDRSTSMLTMLRGVIPVKYVRVSQYTAWRLSTTTSWAYSKVFGWISTRHCSLVPYPIVMMISLMCLWKRTVRRSEMIYFCHGVNQLSQRRRHTFPCSSIHVFSCAWSSESSRFGSCNIDGGLLALGRERSPLIVRLLHLEVYWIGR